MASTSEHTSDNVNRKEGGEEQEEKDKKNVSTSSIDGEQRQNETTTTTIDDLNHLDKTDILSAMQSSNENNKSNQTSPESDSSTTKINEQQTVASSTIRSQQESQSTISDSNKDNHDQNKQDQSATVTSSLIRSDDTDKNDERNTSTDKDIKAFPIEKGDEQHLTDFQRQKAKYFFNVNLGMLLLLSKRKPSIDSILFSFLDIENKEYITWEDVEFYLLVRSIDHVFDQHLFFFVCVVSFNNSG